MNTFLLIWNFLMSRITYITVILLQFMGWVMSKLVVSVIKFIIGFQRCHVIIDAIMRTYKSTRWYESFKALIIIHNMLLWVIFSFLVLHWPNSCSSSFHCWWTITENSNTLIDFFIRWLVKKYCFSLRVNKTLGNSWCLRSISCTSWNSTFSLSELGSK